MKSLTVVTLGIASLSGLAMFAARTKSSAETTAPRISGPAQPVLVELFTSEGCSSCPPADRLLQKLDRTQPVAGARIIVLSEHVDYWNSLGWRDPYSSALFTQRQQNYVARLHLSGAYTPQAVTDGQGDAIGSDEGEIRAAIGKAESRTKIPVDVQAQRSGANAQVQIQVGADSRGAAVYVALADDHAQSQVSRGENSGHTLQHVAVVRTLQLAGKTDGRSAFAKTLTLPIKDPNAGAWRVVVFLEDSSSRILGSAEAGL
jgi:hypothetical protein